MDLNIFVIYSGIKPVERTTSLRGAKEKAEDCLGNRIVEYAVCGSIYNPQLDPKHVYKKTDWGAKNWMELDLSVIETRNI